jgi:hypothetical protein
LDDSLTHCSCRTVEIHGRRLLGQNAHAFGALEQDARGDRLEKVQRLAIGDLLAVAEDEYDTHGAWLVAELSRRSVSERMFSESVWRW